MSPRHAALIASARRLVDDNRRAYAAARTADVMLDIEEERRVEANTSAAPTKGTPNERSKD